MTGLGGSGSISHLAVYSIFTNKNDSVVQAMIQEYNLRRARTGLSFLSSATLLPGLFFCSYHARELLVCWLFFCLLFAMLTVVFIGAVLACSAGKYLTERVLAMVSGTPELPLCLPEVQQEIILEKRIAIFPPCEVAAVSQLALEMLDYQPYPLIPAASRVEASVQ